MSNATTFKFNNGLMSGGREPRLWFVKGGQAVKFVGQNIKGYCVVASEKFNKNGKWSNTDYSLLLSPGVRAIYLCAELHQKWGYDCECWGDVAAKLALPIELAKTIINTEYPKSVGQRLDAVDEFYREEEKAETQ